MKKLYVVGIGPGNEKNMTLQAQAAIAESQILCGYTVYIELLKQYWEGKKLLSTPMTKEIDRCHMALQEAAKGNTVAFVCSGDAGIYGMAGLLYTLAQEYEEIEIEVIPGITAAVSGAAVLGAPLIHDFAVISLSDLLTPWELIEKRLRLAAQADFVLCLYNPSSKKRKDYLKRACKIVLEYQPESLICGYVKNIGREEESGEIMTLKDLKDISADMFTTVFIGNSQTKIVNGKMVTPRGYRNER